MNRTLFIAGFSFFKFAAQPRATTMIISNNIAEGSGSKSGFAPSPLPLVSYNKNITYLESNS